MLLKGELYSLEIVSLFLKIVMKKKPQWLSLTETTWFTDVPTFSHLCAFAHCCFHLEFSFMSHVSPHISRSYSFFKAQLQ